MHARLTGIKNDWTRSDTVELIVLFVLCVVSGAAFVKCLAAFLGG